jgi:hypothetical protein
VLAVVEKVAVDTFLEASPLDTPPTLNSCVKSLVALSI